MPVRYRRARPEDIPNASKFLEPERPLLSPAIWSRLPRLLDDLVRRERILLCVFEDTDTGRLRFLGASGFVAPDFVEMAVKHPRKSILELALTGESQHRPVFLGRRQVAEANRSVDLRMLNFLGVPIDSNPDDPNEDLMPGNITDCWNFFHKGFQFREIWTETAHPFMQQIMTDLKLVVFRESLTTDGQPVKLFHVTREHAIKSAHAWPESAMVSPLPRFGFTGAEQKLLELVLLDYSDREVADQLNISLDAIKKRWRSIYANVSEVDPSFLGSDVNGADRRRILLQRLRHNLEELRPF